MRYATNRFANKEIGVMPATAQGPCQRNFNRVNRARVGAGRARSGRQPQFLPCRKSGVYLKARRVTAAKFIRQSARPLVRSSASPQVRSSASPQVRSSARPLVRKSASPQVRKSASPPASPQVRKSASPQAQTRRRALRARPTKASTRSFSLIPACASTLIKCKSAKPLHTARSSATSSTLALAFQFLDNNPIA